MYICIYFISTVAAKGFVQCKKSDIKFNDCIKEGIQSAIPHLVNGKKRKKPN